MKGEKKPTFLDGPRMAIPGSRVPQRQRSSLTSRKNRRERKAERLRKTIEKKDVVEVRLRMGGPKKKGLTYDEEKNMPIWKKRTDLSYLKEEDDVRRQNGFIRSIKELGGGDSLPFS